MLVSFLGAFIRADGSPKFVMLVTLIGGAINIIGDIVLVFPCKMGMTGAALATVSGSAVQTVMLLTYILLGKTSLHLAKPYKLFRAVHKICIVGFGAGLSQVALTVVSFVINNQIMQYAGSAALAVYGFLGTVSALFLSVFAGIGQAVQPIVAENYGAGLHIRHGKVCRTGMITAVVFGAGSLAVCALFPSQIVDVFMESTAEVDSIAPYIIRVTAISFVPMAVNMFAVAYLQSVAKANKASLLSLLRGMILPVVLLYVLPVRMNGNGIWWALTLAEGATAVLAVVFIANALRKAR